MFLHCVTYLCGYGVSDPILASSTANSCRAVVGTCCNNSPLSAGRINYTWGGVAFLKLIVAAVATLYIFELVNRSWN